MATTVIALVMAGLLWAGPASAAFEQVGTFGGPADLGQQDLFLAQSIAINESGEGGVAPGTIYIANICEGGRCGVGHANIATYAPDGTFIASLPITGATASIAIDQATGNIFIERGSAPGTDAIHEYSPDGSEELASFGEIGTFGETAETGPDKVHTPGLAGSALAVDGAGNVYVADRDSGNHGRVMVFNSVAPGVYSYAGTAQDLAKGFDPTLIALDHSGNLYTLSEHSIFKFAPGSATPVCKFEAPAGSVGFGAVDPVSGDVFYRLKGKSIRQMACGATGTFEEVGVSIPSPQITVNTSVPIAFNASLRWPAGAPGGERAIGTLYAIDGAELSPSEALGYVFAPSEANPPSILSESATQVRSSSAVLGAEINPRAHAARYAFQYLPTSQYVMNPPATPFDGAVVVPVGGGVVGAGNTATAVSVSISGLAPDTAYRYRVIASSHCDADPNAICEAFGAAEEFRTYPPPRPELSDGRAYERVSPAEKLGGEVSPLYPELGSCSVQCKAQGGVGGFPILSTSGGDTVVYRGQPFSSTTGPATTNQYIARRSPTGWNTTSISLSLQGRLGYRAFDPSLTKGIFAQESIALTSNAPSGYPNLYLEGTSAPLVTPTALVGAQPPNRPQGSAFKPVYAGSSVDLGRIFFSANDALTGPTAFAPAAEPPLEVVEPEVKVLASNLYEWIDGQLSLVNVLPGNEATVPGGAAFGFGPRTISADGSRAFWNDGENGKVYVRVRGVETAEIPGKGNCHFPLESTNARIAGACFVTASTDGSRVLLGEGELFALAPDGHSYQQIGQLGTGAGFLGITGQSDNLATVYFVNTALISGAEVSPTGEHAKAGDPNLYAWINGAVTFIGVLSAENIATGNEDIRVKTWDIRPSHRAAEASPDGRWLAFLTQRSLNGVKNTGPCGNSGEEAECLAAYLYDSATGTLRCVSCSPAGEAPLGASHLPLLGSAADALAQPYYLTNEGRLYFDTRNSLSPADTNAGVEDVYEFEPQGIGGCARAGGCVSLISPGNGSADSNFAAIDPTGANVFFTSRSQLVPSDKDELVDFYDAREGGGFAFENEAPPSECQGESCQPTSTGQDEPAPTSAGVAAEPPAKHLKCKKGQVKKKGHCVKKSHKKHKKRHGKKKQKANKAPSAKGGSK